jgi:hypothetical protein
MRMRRITGNGIGIRFMLFAVALSMGLINSQHSLVIEAIC